MDEKNICALDAAQAKLNAVSCKLHNAGTIIPVGIRKNKWLRF